VRAVFINIFGGILRCDVLATGVGGGGKRICTSAFRWSCGWKEPTWSEGSRFCGQWAEFHNCGWHEDGAQKVVALAGGAR